MPNQRVVPTIISPLSKSLERPVLRASNDFTPLPQESLELFLNVAKIKGAENLVLPSQLSNNSG